MADSWKQELEGSINGHMSTSILLLLSAETVFINELFLIVHKKTFYMNDLLPFKSTNQRKKINYSMKFIYQKERERYPSYHYRNYAPFFFLREPRVKKKILGNSQHFL